MTTREYHRDYQRVYRQHNLERLRLYQREWERRNRNLGPRNPDERRGRPRIDGTRSASFPRHLVVKHGHFVISFD